MLNILFHEVAFIFTINQNSTETLFDANFIFDMYHHRNYSSLLKTSHDEDIHEAHLHIELCAEAAVCPLLDDAPEI